MKYPIFTILAASGNLAFSQTGPLLHVTDTKPVATFESTSTATAATVKPLQAPSAVGVQYDLVYPLHTLIAVSVQVEQPATKLVTQSARVADGRWRIAAYTTDSQPLPTDLSWQLILALGVAAPPEGPLVTVENLLFTTNQGTVLTPSSSSYGSLAEWKLNQFTAPERANPLFTADDSDADGDGLTNLAEFITNTSPKVSEPEKAPQAAPGVAGQLAMRFSTARDTRALLVIPQTSSDLKTWTSQGVNITLTGAEDANSVEKLAQVPTTTPHQYLRLKFVRPQ